MPYHMQEDAARESSAEGGAIGTTRRGIGPAYADKMHRSSAIRVADLMHEEKLAPKSARSSPSATRFSKFSTTSPPMDWRQIFESYRDFGRRIAAVCR